MIPKAIKAIILCLLHYAWHSYKILQFAFISLYYYALTTYVETNNNLINTNIPYFKDLRIPRHIALSFTNEANYLDLESIARLLCWCKQLNIDYITLYDDLGRIKNRRKELIKFVELKMRSLGCDKPIDQVEGLNIISKVDGRQKFLDDIKSLVSKYDSKSINVSLVQNHVGWPTDPELLIVFGLPICLYGFPPWQLRLTEIFDIPTHRRLPQRIFVDCLKRYSKTSQRIGA